jgi:hypothetical protein
VRESANGTLIAHHRDHHWEIQGERYFRLDATSRVHIHFEQMAEDAPMAQRTSRHFGPYERFSAVDGIAFTYERVFAFVDSKIGDWFCYEDGQHWPVMVVSDAAVLRERGLWARVAALAPLVPGVIGLWQQAKLLYLGQAESIQSRLLGLTEGEMGVDPARVTAVTWEAHPDPAAREAELLAEYAAASRSLRQTYGRFHGNLVRSARLIEKAKETTALARSIYARACSTYRNASLAAA